VPSALVQAQLAPTARLCPFHHAKLHDYNCAKRSFIIAAHPPFESSYNLNVSLVQPRLLHGVPATQLRTESNTCPLLTQPWLYITMSLSFLIVWTLCALSPDCWGPAGAVAAENDRVAPLPNCASETFDIARLHSGIKILSVSAEPKHNFTSISGGPGFPSFDSLDFCRVQVRLTHLSKNELHGGDDNPEDEVLVEAWLPLSRRDWNARLQATGGAGFATGMFGAHLGAAVKDGWAAVSTDGGHEADLSKLSDASWTLEHDSRLRTGKPDWGLLHNFASRSLVDQIKIGKTIVEHYYGMQPRYSYWNGCSTGGRQGYAIAQKYPHLLDGILANAPAIGFVDLLMGTFWPQLAMEKHKTFLSPCELELFRLLAIDLCDMNDGVEDGVLEDPAACNFIAKDHVGETFMCEGVEVTITEAMAKVINEIHDGPGAGWIGPTFPGLAWGVPMSALANITVGEDGVPSMNPFRISASFIHHMLHKNSQTVDARKLVKSIAEYHTYWISAQSEYGGLLNHNDPDLSGLQASGAKLLTWHGINDQVVPYQNTVNYRKKVEAVMGGAAVVDEFYRLFLAPGVKHCSGGTGPVPKDPLDALVRWVEYDEPPEILEAGILDLNGELATRELCAWPAKSKYMGVGDAKRASSWTCVEGTSRPSESVFQDESYEYEGMQQPHHVAKQPEAHLANSEHESDNGRVGNILGGLKGRMEGLGMGLRVN
jgi:hypothetical protein